METLLASGGILEDMGINLKVWATQVVIFILTFLVLSRLLFGRVLEHVTRREGEVRKSQEAIEHDRAEVARLMKEYEAHLLKADKEAYDRTQALLKEAIAQSQALVAKAQADARQEVERALAEVAREKQDALARLRTDVARLSLDVAERVLETKLDPSAHGAEVQKFLSERA
jgi:F-type H+-transporting ATPase subunit b